MKVMCLRSFRFEQGHNEIDKNTGETVHIVEREVTIHGSLRAQDIPDWVTETELWELLQSEAKPPIYEVEVVERV